MKFRLNVSGCIFSCTLLCGISLHAQVISTFAGNGGSGFSGDGGPATASQIPNPYRGSFDAAGNYYFGEAFGGPRIRKIDLSGNIQTVAGNGTPGFSGDGGPATAAQLHPIGNTVDKTGNIFIADQYNNRIRKVNAITHIINTIAGNGAAGFSGDGGQATDATLIPGDICVDSLGNIYFTDASYRIRKIDTFGIVSTIAGNGSGGATGYSGDGGQASTAEIGGGSGICLDNFGNLYFGGSNSLRIRKMNLGTGIIGTFAGTGTGSYNGDEIHADSANFWENGFCLDAMGNMYIADYGNYRVRKIDDIGIIYTAAGNGSSGYSGDGGNATAAEIHFPEGVAIDLCGNLYIADEANDRIRKVTFPPTPTIITLASPTSAALSSTVTLTASITGGCCTHTDSIIWMDKGVVFATTTTNTVTYTKTINTDSITARAVGCGDTAMSGVYVITKSNAGVPELSASNGFQVFPNPAHNVLYVSGGMDIENVVITDIVGQTVYSGKETTINVSGFAKGVYFMKINGAWVQKFLKE